MRLERRGTAGFQGNFAGPSGYQWYGELSRAWDLLQLGQLDASSQALQQAIALRANPVVVQWIRDELAYQRGG